MSAQNSAGIQTLLDAEREAQKIVQKAREYRTKRVKEARDGAKKEIETYRELREEEFKKFEAEHTRGNKKAEDDANRDAEEEIREIKIAGERRREIVTTALLREVWDPKPTIPDRVKTSS